MMMIIIIMMMMNSKSEKSRGRQKPRQPLRLSFSLLQPLQLSSTWSTLRCCHHRHRHCRHNRLKLRHHYSQPAQHHDHQPAREVTIIKIIIVVTIILDKSTMSTLSFMILNKTFILLSVVGAVVAYQKVFRVGGSRL